GADGSVDDRLPRLRLKPGDDLGWHHGDMDGGHLWLAAMRSGARTCPGDRDVRAPLRVAAKRKRRERGRKIPSSALASHHEPDGPVSSSLPHVRRADQSPAPRTFNLLDRRLVTNLPGYIHGVAGKP